MALCQTRNKPTEPSVDRRDVGRLCSLTGGARFQCTRGTINGWDVQEQKVSCSGSKQLAFNVSNERLADHQI